MISEFGVAPYKACSFYGSVASVPAATTTAESGLTDILKACKQGDFSVIRDLAMLMTADSFDTRQYAGQLFAHVCNHRQVATFTGAIEAAEDKLELCRIAIRLGETLSLNAIPLLFSMHAEYKDDEIDGYICTALRNILPLAGVSEDTTSTDNAHRVYASAMQDLDARQYYYRGRPVFTGDVTKELLQAVLFANREQRKVVLIRQPQLLSHFSGIECPVENGQPIADDDVRTVYDYVEVLAGIPWQIGAKYFYQHVIS